MIVVGTRLFSFEIHQSLGCPILRAFAKGGIVDFQSTMFLP
jgi:hypothetical protein